MTMTLEKLIALDPSYHFDKTTTTMELERVNEMIKGIANTRSTDMPMPGDIIKYTNKYGMYYDGAHVDAITLDNELDICEKPYVPFISGDTNHIRFSTSGGAWTLIPRNLKYLGKAQKRFAVWGRRGPCPNGAIEFMAEVNVWEYDCNEQAFSTKERDRLHVSVNDKHPSGYKYFISKTGMDWALRTDEEYEAWKETFKGVEQPGSCLSSSRIVWTYKHQEFCTPLADYLALENAIIDSELWCGGIQECKRVYEGTTVTTYLPFQNDKIVLDGKPRYMAAQKIII